MNAVTRYEPDEQFDLVAEITRKPDADPVQEYLNTLKSAASVSTMEQALGVVVSLLAGAGRPDNRAQQKRDDRKATAAKMKQAAHDYNWFDFDGKKAKALIAALSRENYADASREKMVAAVVGVLDEVEDINVQAQLDAQARLDDEPMPAQQKLTMMQMVDLYFGRRALTTQAAKTEIKKAKNADRKAREEAAKAQPAAPKAALSTIVDTDPAQPQRKRRKGTIDRSTKGASEHRQLTKREMNALWAVCTQDGAKGARDMCIIALGFGCGLRRSEIAALQYADIDWNGKRVKDTDGEDVEVSRDLQIDGAGGKGEAYLPITIRHGKGDKKRIVNASNGTRQALLQWAKVRGNDPGPLLYSFDRWTGMQKGKPIDSQVIYSVCDELATRAKVEKFSPHDMRRTFISGFLAASKDLAMAKQLAGHSNVQTTTIYDLRGEDAKARASVEHVHVPFEQVTVQEKLDDAKE